MTTMRETYALDVPARLESAREAVERVVAWLQLQGHDPARLKRWKLPLTEAVNNGILHGCAGRSDAAVKITVHVGTSGTEVSVRDPGHFDPGAKFSQLPDDPLAESGRGGFLIAEGTDSFEHRNDRDGHVLVLRWNDGAAGVNNLGTAASAESTLDSLALQLGDAYETVTAYADFAGLLATTDNFPGLLEQVRGRLSRAVAHDRFVLRLIEGDQLVLGVPADGVPPSIPLAVSGIETGVATARDCIAFMSPAEIPAGDPLTSATGPVVVVSVACPRKRHGTLTLLRAAGAPAFSAGNIVLAQAVANFLGIARATAELWAQRATQVRLEQELEMAARIQNSLLPQTPPLLPGWKVAGNCRQSRAVGGDYFDWVMRDDGSCLVLVADVMGKGMPAAMVATILRSTWRTLAAFGHGPGRLLTELNHQLSRDLNALDVFITAVLVQISAGGGRVTTSNAGHCPLLHRSATGVVLAKQPGGGPPLGIESGVAYPEGELQLQRGDWLFAYTDGCYEFSRARGNRAGFEIFEHEVQSAVASHPDTVVDRVLDRLDELMAGDAPDDCTLVAMRLLP